MAGARRPPRARRRRAPKRRRAQRASARANATTAREATARPCRKPRSTSTTHAAYAASTDPRCDATTEWASKTERPPKRISYVSIATSTASVSAAVNATNAPRAIGERCKRANGSSGPMRQKSSVKASEAMQKSAATAVGRSDSWCTSGMAVGKTPSAASRSVHAFAHAAAASATERAAQSVRSAQRISPTLLRRLRYACTRYARPRFR